MPKVTVRVSVYRDGAVRDFLLGMPRKMKNIAAKAIGKQGEYSLRENTEPPYKKVTRLEVYGKSFFSDEQRRFFFWALAEGIIQVPHPRSHKQREGWKAQYNPESVIFTNKAPNLEWTIGEPQGRMAIAKGWKKAEELINDATPAMLQAAEDAITTHYSQRPWAK